MLKGIVCDMCKKHVAIDVPSDKLRKAFPIFLCGVCAPKYGEWLRKQVDIDRWQGKG